MLQRTHCLVVSLDVGSSQCNVGEIALVARDTVNSIPVQMNIMIYRLIRSRTDVVEQFHQMIIDI